VEEEEEEEEGIMEWAVKENGGLAQRLTALVKECKNGVAVYLGDEGELVIKLLSGKILRKARALGGRCY